RKSSRSCFFPRCESRSGGLGAAAGVFLLEALDASSGVHDLLLARIERMTGRADFDVQRAPERRSGRERVAAAAGNGDLRILRMAFFLHGVLQGFAGDRRLSAMGAASCNGCRARRQAYMGAITRISTAASG